MPVQDSEGSFQFHWVIIVGICAEYGIASKKQIFPLLLFPTLDNIGSDRRR